MAFDPEIPTCLRISAEDRKKAWAGVKLTDPRALVRTSEEEARNQRAKQSLGGPEIDNDA